MWLLKLAFELVCWGMQNIVLNMFLLRQSSSKKFMVDLSTHIQAVHAKMRI